MADVLIYSLIEQLASTALDQIKEKVRLVSDVEESVKDFASNLQIIQVVLKDAEKRRVNEDVVQVWLDNLKGVAYDMDNVLDEWNTQALKQLIQKQEKENALVNKIKVRFSIPSPFPSKCFCFGQGSRGIIDKRSIGQEYFNNLVMRSFFQNFQIDDYGNIQNCKMHDIVHDFVQFLSKNESFIVEPKGGKQAIVFSSDGVHHLTLMLAAEGPLSVPPPFHTCKKLRSLTIFSKRKVTTIDGDLILQLKCLRALNLSRSGVEEIPKEIGELLHLRYIDLSWNKYLKELPDAMCNLCNLETLHLESCYSLEKLPKSMEKLINLQHLYVQYSGISGLPKGLGRLTGLRILDRFVCGDEFDDEKEEILKLGDLGSFEHLQGTLFIAVLGNVKDVCEAQKAQLEKKKHLLELILDFGESESEEQQRISDVAVLNELRPHQHLKILRLNWYQGNSVPLNWMMSLQHLTHLTLWGFQYCESLPPVGKLPYLEVLYVAFMRSVKKVGVELLGIEETQTSPATAFPKLKQLKLEWMEGWEEWEGVGDDCQVTIMPCLSGLEIFMARKLKQLPDFLHNRPLLHLMVGEVHPSLLEQVHQLEEHRHSISATFCGD